MTQRSLTFVLRAGNRNRVLGPFDTLPGVRRLPGERDALERAKARLDRLDLYPEPVRIERIRVFVAPGFFRIPGYRRYRGYTFVRTIVVRDQRPSDDLLTHELCHAWQMQHRALSSTLAWLRYQYRRNPFEIEARRAVDETRA
jgi:hypothetical protein